ncbi:MAG: serine hydrolase [Candidatus Komeilibacteria bacterium]|nr:serine hydrolase [Candidatus Komeilibacteria bacterium]
MILSLIANLIGLYGLLALPVAVSSTIDISAYAEQATVTLLSGVYRQNAPIRTNQDSLGMKVTANSAIVIDQKSGTVLWQKNPDNIQPIASLTKLISVLVWLDNSPGWATEVTVLGSDLRSGGRAYIYAGEKLLARDLFNLSLIPSSNNAIMALARSTGLTNEQFVAKMNELAASLNMTSTKFTEPTGLAPENMSSAADLLKLAQAAFEREEIRSATVRPEYTFQVLNNNRSETVKNTDKLLNSYLRINAGKTGSLDESGYCLMSEVIGPDGQKVLIVVLGSLSDADRFQDVKSLAQWAFDNYTWQ